MSVREPLITTSPDRLSGTPVFAGTRVPVQTLIEYLEAGDSLEAFLDDFPSVSREHAVVVLELAKSALLQKAVAAGTSPVMRFEPPPRSIGATSTTATCWTP
jgi:uncharacterized protein (DUF433 family)